MLDDGSGGRCVSRLGRVGPAYAAPAATDGAKQPSIRPPTHPKLRARKLPNQKLHCLPEAASPLSSRRGKSESLGHCPSTFVVRPVSASLVDRCLNSRTQPNLQNPSWRRPLGDFGSESELGLEYSQPSPDNRAVMECAAVSTAHAQQQVEKPCSLTQPPGSRRGDGRPVQSRR